MSFEVDLSYLDTLIGALEADLDAKLIGGLTEENFTVAMYRAGYLTAETDSSGNIIGWNFEPPQNFDLFLTGTSGNDDLVAGSGDDFVFAGDGNDTVDGGAGNDVLNGGAGADLLTGGDGADVFVFSAADKGTGTDLIADFDPTEGDKIDISDLLIGYDAEVDNLADFLLISENALGTSIVVDTTGSGDFNGNTVAIAFGATGVTVDDLIIDDGFLIA